MPPQHRWVPALIRWYEQTKRDLPWRRTNDPYAVWVSEIMLQQTRVEAVIAYYNRFMVQFPTIHALASAPEEAVLKAWEGLGYYSRARNLHKAAKAVSATSSGEFPRTYDQIKKLPGIGDYTAGAIASIAFGTAVPAIDGNVKRVMSRLLGIRQTVDQPVVLRTLRDTLTQAIPKDQASSFNQALMDLGAMVCIPRAPRCDLCPVARYCDAFAAGDAETLPIIEPKKPPVTVDVAVCLLTFENQILVFRRKERLLQGLYVFGLLEDVMIPKDAQTVWTDRGLETRFIESLGEARHVFTHRIWEMRILHFALSNRPGDDFLHEYNALLVNKEQLKALPLPTAMKAAKKAALQLLD